MRMSRSAVQRMSLRQLKRREANHLKLLANCAIRLESLRGGHFPLCPVMPPTSGFMGPQDFISHTRSERAARNRFDARPLRLVSERVDQNM